MLLATEGNIVSKLYHFSHHYVKLKLMFARFFLLTFLFISLFLPKIASAAASCEKVKIEWDPKVFNTGQTEYTLNFSIKDSNTLTTLQDKYVRLLVDQGVLGGGTYNANPLPVTQENFSFILTGSMITSKEHTGILQWSSSINGTYEDFCSDVNYQVGAIGSCTFATGSIPDKIPPNTSLTVKFVGLPNTEYQLRTSKDGWFPSHPKTKTDAAGQGTFPALAIPGSNGDSLRITAITFSPPTQSCHADTKIDATAPQPTAPQPGPILPGSIKQKAPAKVCQKKGETFDPSKHIDPKLCTKAGGVECGSDTNPAIATAIGCIHTNPINFIEDLFKFLTAIGGGFAFLLMLLGAFQMVSSAGNPETLQAGRDRFQSALIGLLFVIFAVLLLKIIGVDILALPEFKP